MRAAMLLLCLLCAACRAPAVPALCSCELGTPTLPASHTAGREARRGRPAGRGRVWRSGTAHPGAAAGRLRGRHTVSAALRCAALWPLPRDACARDAAPLPRPRCMPTPAPVCACLLRVTCLTLSRAEFERLMGPVEQVLAEHIAQYAQANAAQQAAGQSADAPPPELGEAAAAAGPAKPPSLAGSTAGSPALWAARRRCCRAARDPACCLTLPALAASRRGVAAGAAAACAAHPAPPASLTSGIPAAMQSPLSPSCWCRAAAGWSRRQQRWGQALLRQSRARPCRLSPKIRQRQAVAARRAAALARGSGVHGGGNGKPTGAASRAAASVSRALASQALASRAASRLRASPPGRVQTAEEVRTPHPGAPC